MPDPKGPVHGEHHMQSIPTMHPSCIAQPMQPLVIPQVQQMGTHGPGEVQQVVPLNPEHQYAQIMVPQQPLASHHPNEMPAPAKADPLPGATITPTYNTIYNQWM